jgi:hypothetical protein
VLFRIAAVILVVVALMPRGVERMQIAWPNPGNVTATTQTRWVLIGPSYLPFRYPHWTGGQHLQTSFGPMGLAVLSRSALEARIGWPCWNYMGSAVYPFAQPPAGCTFVGIVSAPSTARRSRTRR